MAGIKKQLLQWRTDWLRYWDKTSLVMRIVIGAGVSLSMASASLNWWNKPLAKEVKDLHKKLDKVVLDNSFNLKVAELKQRRLRLEEQLRSKEKDMARLAATGLSFEALDCNLVMLQLRHYLDKCDLELKHEAQILPPKPEPSGRRRKRSAVSVADDWKTVKNYPDYFETVRYHYRISGDFEAVFAFLNVLPRIPKVFGIYNLAMTAASQELIPLDGSLQVEFDLAIPRPARSVPTASPPPAAGKKSLSASAASTAPASTSTAKTGKKKRR